MVSVSKIRDYLDAGRRVEICRTPATRLSDKPRAQDMVSLGNSHDSDDDRDNDESKYGLVVLDECGTWLNSREWNDKERRALIDWFLHARKRRWDVIFLIQDIESADSQIVRALCEHLVICRRLDRMRFVRIPLPKVHIANVYYGRNKENFVERWMYKGTDLYRAYDTRQQFRDGLEFMASGVVDMRAPYTMLSAWHLKGRYLGERPPPRTVRERLVTYWGGLLVRPLFAPFLLFCKPDDVERAFFHGRRMRALQRAREERLQRELAACEHLVIPCETYPVEDIVDSHNVYYVKYGICLSLRYLSACFPTNVSVEN